MSLTIIIVGVIIALGALIYESPLIALLAIGGALWGFGYATIWAFMTTSPWLVVGAVGAYFITGILFALFVKWPSYIKTTVKAYKQRAAWHGGSKGQKYSVPLASRNKSRIGTWIGYWPIIGLIYFIDDPIRRMISAVIISLRDVFKGVAVKTAKKALANEGLTDDLEDEVLL